MKEVGEEEKIYTHIYLCLSSSKCVPIRYRCSSAVRALFGFQALAKRKVFTIEFGPHKKKKKKVIERTFFLYSHLDISSSTRIERAPNINISKNMTSKDKITHPVELFVYDLR